MTKLGVVSAVAVASMLTPAADLFAQSGSRGSSVFLNRQNQQIRATGTVRNNSINSIVAFDKTRGDAATQINNSLSNLGLGRSRTRSPQRASAATFGNVGSRAAAKPFSGVVRRPSVSPYLGLFTNTFDGDTVNFNQFVRPQLEQQQILQQVQRQQQASQRLQREQARQESATNLRLQQLSARPAFEIQGSRNVPPTGHTTVYGNTLRYYGQSGQGRR